MEVWSKSFEPFSACSPTRHDILRLRDNMQGKNMLRKKYCIPQYVKKKLKKAEVIVHEHALKRWNKRVGPPTTKEDLTTIIKQLIRLNRICFLNDNFGYIDNDILFIYEWSNNKTISIITFYGRVSMNICLQNFSVFRKYNKYQEEHLKLDLSTEELSKQVFPVIPSRVIRYFINWKRYEISIYNILKGERMFMFTEQGEGVNSVQILTEEDMKKIFELHPEIEKYLYQDT